MSRVSRNVLRLKSDHERFQDIGKHETTDLARDTSYPNIPGCFSLTSKTNLQPGSLLTSLRHSLFLGTNDVLGERFGVSEKCPWMGTKVIVGMFYFFLSGSFLIICIYYDGWRVEALISKSENQQSAVSQHECGRTHRRKYSLSESRAIITESSI